MPGHHSPPASVDVASRGVLGLDYRKIVILTAVVPIALGVVLLLRDVPFFLRGALAVLVAGLGVALAFGQIEGKTPESWLWDWIAFGRRARFLLHRALRGADRREVDFGEEAEARAAPRLNVALPHFFLLTADAIGLAALTGLTLWLYGGGAHRLAVWWGSLTKIVS